MSDYAQLAARINSSVTLAMPPVAVTFADEAPSGVAAPAGAAPAGCSFWEAGSKNTIATKADDHKHCSIGIHTHNLSNAPSSQQNELEVTLGAMQGLDYVRPEEVASLPVMNDRSQQVIYGPLEQATQAPSVVLLFCSAAQSLVLTEALARIDGSTPLAMGRPACALVPQVVNSARAATSLGCCGARVYLDVLSDDVAVWGLPGEHLERYVKEIETLSKANVVLKQFHQNRRAAIESGESPSVEQSLATLG